MGRSEAGSIGHLFPVPRFEIKKEIKVKVKIKDRKMKRDEFPDLYEDEPWPSGFSKYIEEVCLGEEQYMNSYSFVEDSRGNYYLFIDFPLTIIPQNDSDIMVEKVSSLSDSESQVYLRVKADMEEVYSRDVRRINYHRFYRTDPESLLKLEETEEEGVFEARFDFDSSTIEQELSN